MNSESLLPILKEKTGCSRIEHISQSVGGLLNACAVVETDQGPYFVKSNKADLLSMFEAEAFGLKKLAATDMIRVPEVIGAGSDENKSFLILEYLKLDSMGSESYGELGEKLARLHLLEGSETFGFDIENTIGTTPQHNGWKEDWVDFFAEQRIGFQLSLIEQNFHDTELLSLGRKLQDGIGLFFKGIEIRPSLLHGDLWSGNTASDSEGHPVVFDPACYYGHHEAELSIAKMFGSFSQEFYQSYHSLIPKDYGFEQRQLIYQLYHYLNHYNLFGKGYRSACIGIMQRLL